MFRKITYLILSPFIFIGCYTTNQISSNDEKAEEKVVVTNIINKTEILEAANLRNSSGSLSLTVKPIDTRLFDLNSNSRVYIGGEHSNVITLVDDIRLEEFETRDREYDNLTDILLREGISSRDILRITKIIDEELEATGGTYVYTDSNIQFESNVGVSNSNPFGRDDRYQTILELLIENDSNEPQSLCENDFFITSGQSFYTNISTNQLLSELAAGSLQYELLHKELLNDCVVIPSNTTLKTHLVFPSFYTNDELKFYWENDNLLQEDSFRIERDVLTNRYYFSKLKVDGNSGKGYRVLGNTTTIDETKYASVDTNSFNFIKIGSSLRYVGFEEFLIHDEIDLQTIELFTVRQKDDMIFDIIKTPITRNDIEDGTLVIQE